jgi:alkylmercury lyase
MTKKRIFEFIDTDISDDEQAIRRVAFQAILGGETIDRAGLVVATGFMPEKVTTLLDGLTERGLVVVEPSSGRVVGSWGLSLVRAGHRLRIRGRALYTWCAEDAIGIPAGLGEDASIISSCHQCGAPVNVEMAAGQVVRALPPDVRLWVTAGDVGRSVVGST